MSSVYAQVEELLPIFQSAYPFSRLSALVCRYLTSRLEVATFSPGQTIYSEGQPVPAIHCLVKGQVQVLGSATAQSPTLAILGAGTVIGWEGWLRSTTSSSVRAAGVEDPVITLALRVDHFEKLAAPEIFPVLAEQLTIAELFEVMNHFVKKLPNPIAPSNLKELVYRIYQQQLAIAYHHFSNTTVPLSSNYLWFISSNHALPIGTPVRSLSALSPYSQEHPVRLIGIDRQTLAKALMPAQSLTSSIVVPNVEKEYIS